jgi:glycosyltransferase involved in cell wall biosynthesis
VIFKLPVDIVVHAFHFVACHWPRPRDLSASTPSASLTIPPPEPSNREDLPSISIVTPSYGYGHFIEWTIRSVLMQGYPNLELIVMDGGSPDATPEIIQKYRPHLKYAESKKDKGQADAVVRGFRHATGEIMGYLNSDDMLAPGALDFVGQFFLDHPDVDMVYSHRVIVDDNNIVTGHWIVPEHSDWYMQRWDYIPQETCFWRRSLYEKVGGIDPKYKFALDFDLFVRFMRAGAKIVRVDRFLGAFRVHEVSKTSSELEEGKVHPEVARVWRKYKVELAHWQQMPAIGIREWIDVKSRKFAVSGKSLPGALPGIGYNFDQAWGGVLNDGTMPPEPAPLASEATQAASR